MTPEPLIPKLRRYERACMWCGGAARVHGPEGWDDLDVEAEFSAQGRAFGDENEVVGVGCVRCSVQRWKAEAHASSTERA